MAMPATTTLAEAPINVPLPPKQAPSDKAHHTGIMTSRPPTDSSIDLIIGIMVATNGMLSITLERIAELHKIKYVIAVRLPPVSSKNQLPRARSTPVSSKP